MSSSSSREDSEKRQPQYEDLDIDYRNFVQFQRAAARRRMRSQLIHDPWLMPEEFAAEFGKPKSR